MISEFKFFRGISKKARVLRVDWGPELMDNGVNHTDIVSELSRALSEQISREIDNDIVNQLTRRINGGYNQRA
jgi:hypothetical protein